MKSRDRGDTQLSFLSPKTLEWRPDDEFRATAVDPLAPEGAPSGQQMLGNVAWTCRHFGISRKTFYKWRQRYHEHGDAGLADRARAPHHSPAGHASRGREQDPVPPAALPFRPREDCRLSEAVSQPLGGLCLRPSHSAQARHEPPPGESKIPAACAPLDALREGAAGPSAAGRRQVSRAHSGHAPAVLPIHGDRRLHPHSRAEGLRRLQSTDGHRIHR